MNQDVCWRLVALSDPNDCTRVRAVEDLGLIGVTESVPFLLKALRDDAFSVRWAAAEALGRLRDARAESHLILSLQDSAFVVRRAAARSLEYLRSSDSIAALPEVRRKEASHRNPENVEVLCNLDSEPVTSLQDKDFEKRLAAALVLDATGWHPANNTERAIYAIASCQWAVLEEAGPEATEPLLHVLKDTNKEVRQKAARALAKIGERFGDARIIGPFATARADDDAEVQQIAVIALLRIIEAVGYYHDERGFEPLLAALQDNYWIVREAAAHALGNLGNHQAVRALTALLQDPYRRVRRAAGRALHLLNYQPSSNPESAGYRAAFCE